MFHVLPNVYYQLQLPSSILELYREDSRSIYKWDAVFSKYIQAFLSCKGFFNLLLVALQAGSQAFVYVLLLQYVWGAQNPKLKIPTFPYFNPSNQLKFMSILIGATLLFDEVIYSNLNVKTGTSKKTNGLIRFFFYLITIITSILIPILLYISILIGPESYARYLSNDE